MGKKLETVHILYSRVVLHGEAMVLSPYKIGEKYRIKNFKIKNSVKIHIFYRKFKNFLERPGFRTPLAEPRFLIIYALFIVKK